MFILLLATALVLGLSAFYAFDQSADTFHPMIYLGALLAFPYVWMPAKMYASGQLYDFYTDNQAALIQFICLLGCIALSLGCLTALPRAHRQSQVTAFPDPLLNSSLRRVTLVFGCLAWIAAVYTEKSDAFGINAGIDGSGYVIELYHLLVPCTAMILLLQDFSKGRARTYVTAMILAAPLLARGLGLGKRGPTFMILGAIAMSWYLRRAKRPSMPTLLTAGLGVGALLMFLYVYRSRGLWSNEFQDIEGKQIVDTFSTANAANEYIYGGAGILHSFDTEKYYWGRRYLAQLVVRPVPRYLWPDKYADFGVPELEENAGTRASEFAATLGFVGAPGAAPGIIGDLWLEFSWLAIPAMWLIGWVYGTVWRLAMQKGEIWMIQYVILTSLAIYLVMQTMEAVTFRCLIMSLPFWIVHNHLNNQRQRQSLVSPRFRRLQSSAQ